MCDITGRYNEIVPCPSCGNMCHPPSTKFETTPKLGEYIKWCCLCYLREVQEAKPSTSKGKEVEAPPPMLIEEVSFPHKKETLLTELLQEYLSIQAKHDHKPEHCDNASQRSQEPSPTMPQSKRTLAEMRNKSYSFGRDQVAKAFSVMCKMALNCPHQNNL